METEKLFSYKDTWLIKLIEKVTVKQGDVPKKENPNSFPNSEEAPRCCYNYILD